MNLMQRLFNDYYEMRKIIIIGFYTCENIGYHSLISCLNSNTIIYVRMTGCEVKKRLPIILMYNVGSTLGPFSSFVNLKFVAMGIFMCLAISQPNFLNKFLAYLPWDMKSHLQII